MPRLALLQEGQTGLFYDNRQSTEQHHVKVVYPSGGHPPLAKYVSILLL